jgi:hypothetical protein
MDEHDNPPAIPPRNPLDHATSPDRPRAPPGTYAEKEIDFGFALLSREKANSESAFDSIFATVAISVIKRTSLNADGDTLDDGLLVLAFTDDRKQKQVRVESSLAKAHQCFEAACDAIEHLASLKTSPVKSTVSIPLAQRLRVVVCREGSRTSVSLQLGDLSYYINQRERFVSSISNAFVAATTPLRLSSKRITRLLS